MDLKIDFRDLHNDMYEPVVEIGDMKVNNFGIHSMEEIRVFCKEKIVELAWYLDEDDLIETLVKESGYNPLLLDVNL